MKTPYLEYELTEYATEYGEVLKGEAKELARRVGFPLDTLYFRKLGHTIDGGRWKLTGKHKNKGDRWTMYELTEMVYKEVNSIWGTAQKLADLMGITYQTISQAYQFGYMLAGRYKVTDKRRISK